MRALAVLIVLLGAGCRFDPTVPAGSEVLCFGAADCPTGYRCSDDSRCVPKGSVAGDVALVSATITPTLAKAGTRVDVVVVAEGQLAAAPFERLIGTRSTDGAGQFALASTPPQPGDALGTFRFTYTPAGTEPQGPQRLTLSVVDTSAARHELTLPGLLTLDFEPPAVVSQSMRLIPSTANPLTAPTRLGLGAQLEVVVVLDEAVAQATLDAGADLPFTSQMLTPTVVIFHGTPASASIPQGPARLELDVADVAGNARRVALASTVIIDTVAPDPVDTSADGGAVLHRAPWGARATNGAPAVWLDGLGAAVRESGTLIVSSDGSELTRALIDPQQSQTVQLGSLDRDTVFVSLVDEAGNASTPVRVRSIEWIASLGGTLNPNVLEARQVWLEPRTMPVRDVDDTAAAARVDFDGDAGAVISEAAAQWVRRSETNPATANGGLVTDPATGRPLFFGDADGGFYEAALQWDGEQWYQLPVSDVEGDGEPFRTTPMRLTVDTNRQTVLRWAQTSELWMWTGHSWERQRPLDPEGDGDPLGYSPVLAYDRAHAVTLRYGGFLSVPLTDTWEWTSRSWRKVNVPVEPPSHSGQAAGFYDPRLDSLVIFGGAPPTTDSFRLVRGDGGAAWVPTSSLPVACQAMEVAYDELAGRAITRGGTTASSATCPSLIWTSATASWSLGTFSGAAPADARYCTPVWDGAAKEIALPICGSATTTVLQGDAFALATGSNAFTRRKRVRLPVSLSEPRVDWSPFHQAFFFPHDGGYPPTLWDGTQVRNAGVRVNYDLSSVVADDYRQLLWLKEPSPNLATLQSALTVVSSSAPGDAGGQLAPIVLPDAGTALLMVGGGFTWLYNGGWTFVGTGGPSSSYATIAEIPDSGSVVSMEYGGAGVDIVVQVYRATDGWSSWTARDGGIAAPTAPRFAVDRDRRAAVLGNDYEWTEAEGWRRFELSFERAQSLSSGTELRWDRVRKRVVSFGYPLSELTRAENRPALVLHVPLTNARIPLGALKRELVVDAVAGARGHDDSATPIDGAEVRLWWGLGWSVPTGASASAHTAPATSPAPLTLRVPQPDALFEGDAPVLSVMLRPRATAGAASSRIALDAVEVRVSYVVP